jgi:hypothetical protein
MMIMSGVDSTANMFVVVVLKSKFVDKVKNENNFNSLHICATATAAIQRFH